MVVSNQTERSSNELYAVWRLRCLRAWALIGLCALVAILGIVMEALAVPVGIIIWTIIFVFCLRPIVSGLAKRGVNRAWGTTIAFVVMFLVVGLLVFVMVTPAFGVSDQFAGLVENLPGYYSQFVNWFNGLRDQYSSVLQNAQVQQWLTALSGQVSDWIGSFSRQAASGIVDFGAFVVNSCVVIGFALVIAFWILLDLPGIHREFGRLFAPSRKEDIEMILSISTRVIGGYIKGTLIQCLIIGVGCGVSYAVIGLPFPAALGIITGVMNILPVIGPWLGGALAAGVGIVVSPWAALAALIAAVVIQQIVYTFISPKVLADQVDIHPVLVIFGLTLGSAVGGIMAGLAGSIFGMLAAIPIIGAIKAIFAYYYEKRTGRSLIRPDGVFFQGDATVMEELSTAQSGKVVAPNPTASDVDLSQARELAHDVARSELDASTTRVEPKEALEREQEAHHKSGDDHESLAGRVEEGLHSLHEKIDDALESHEHKE